MASFKGKSNCNRTRIAEDQRTNKNVGTRNFKIYSDIEKIKVPGRESVGNDTIKTAKKPLMTTRKSIPATKGVPRTDLSNVKGNIENSEKCMGNHYKSVKIKIGRKVLADVSNFGSYMLRNGVNDRSKPQISIAPSTGCVNASSRKSLLGKTRANQNQASYNRHVNKKVDIKDFKVFSENHKAKGHACEHGSINCRLTARKPLMITRAPERQSTANARTMSKKPVMPNLRAALNASKAQTNSKLKSKMAPNAISTNSSSSKREEEVMPSVPDNTQLVVPHQSSLEKLQSDGRSCLCTSESNIIPRSKCNRRRSYTSLLMARSKVLGEHSEVFKQKELPSIDDTGNQLEVAEYVDEIYQYYWVMEAQGPSVTNYMTTQTEITPKMRGILINWLIEVHLKFELMQETLFLMVALFDRYLSMVSIKKNEMQLVGLTSLLLASKYEDFWHPKVKDLISIAADSYTRNQMLGMEKNILKKLMFRLNIPTPYVFMLRFLKAAQSDTKLEDLAFYIIELCLVEYEALKFKPSLLCASAIYVARCTLCITPAWTTLLEKHACYEESQLKECSEMILRFLKAAGKGMLKVTYEKYMCSDHSCVAAIKAVDSIPL